MAKHLRLYVVSLDLLLPEDEDDPQDHCEAIQRELTLDLVEAYGADATPRVTAVRANFTKALA